MPKFLLAIAIAFGALFFNSLGFAQDAEMGLTKLSIEEEKRYREILDKPIDSSALNSSKINSYIEKDNASHILGELKLREANLIEWAKIDGEGRLNLRGFYSITGNHHEAIKLGLQLLNDPDRRVTWPPTKVRTFAYLAGDYMQINDLPKAFEMLKTAESQILGLRNTPGRNVQAWSSWAESNVALMKSIYLMRTGKWDESFVQIKISVEKSKEVLPMLNLFENDKQKMHAKNNAAFIMANMVNQQIQVGQLIPAESSLRDAFKFAKANGFNENHMFAFDLLSANLFNGNGHFQSSMKYIETAQKMHMSQGYLKTNRRWMRTKSLELTALSGLDQWDKAYKVLQES